MHELRHCAFAHGSFFCGLFTGTSYKKNPGVSTGFPDPILAIHISRLISTRRLLGADSSWYAPEYQVA
jgi:hypothetical protein